MGMKSRLNLTVDSSLLERVKEKADEKHLSISSIVENFFEFFVNPYVYCFNCGSKFCTETSEDCPVCSWVKCPECGACGCNLDDEVVKTAYHMRKVYEDLLFGRVTR